MSIFAVATLQTGISAKDWGAVLPELIVAGGALLMLLLDVISIPRKTQTLSIGAMVITALAGLSSYRLWTTGTQYAMNFTVTADKFAMFFNAIILLSLALAILLSPDYIERSAFDPGEYYALLLASASGMMLMAAGLSFMVLFIALELLSLSLYILAGFARGSERSQEAGFKYFLLSSFASAFLIYGMALIYGATGWTQLNGIALCLHAAPGTGCSSTAANSALLYVGIALMLVGFAFKVSVVPFHMWTPDVYQGAPTPITAFMSVTTKAAVFAAFVRVFNLSLASVEAHWFGLIWALAIVTMVGGNLLALVQTNMKRLLAYSGVAHAGYVLVAMAANNAAGETAVAFYFLAYAFMNIGAFVLIRVLESRGEAGDEIATYRGLYYRNPSLAWFTAIFMFSLAGFPPFAGFIAKYFVFQAVVQANHTELAVAGVVTSLVSIYYYLRVVVYMFAKPETAQQSEVRIPGAPDIALAAAAAGSVGLGIIPTGFFNLAGQAVDAVRPYFGL
ncbi:MAG: NADH-quinone oxidoreductase subunit N [Chloroflexota bacterium]